VSFLRVLVLLSSAIAVVSVGCAAPEDEGVEVAEGALGALPGTAVYPADRTHSPITAAVARRLQQIGAGRPDVFAKVGDSQTVSDAFMHCLGRGSVDLGAHAALDPTRRFFLGDDLGEDTFRRTSLAAKVGASASFAADGALASEVEAIDPRYAVVMYGSNDIQLAPTAGLRTFVRDMLRVTDQLLARGVVPLLSSPPPRPFRSYDVEAFGPAGADPWAPRFANVVRTIAQGRQVPFMDLQAELRRAPDMGIGSDRLHLAADPRGACAFDDAGLRFGANLRNVVTLTSLDRARAAVEGRAVLDSAVGLAGSGTRVDPFRVRRLPFGDLRSLRDGPIASGEIAGACTDAPPVRFRYRVEQVAAGRVHLGLHAGPTSAGAADPGLRLLRQTGASCVAVARNDAVVDLAAGTHELLVASTAASATEVVLTVTPDL